MSQQNFAKTMHEINLSGSSGIWAYSFKYWFSFQGELMMTVITLDWNFWFCKCLFWEVLLYLTKICNLYFGKMEIILHDLKQKKSLKKVCKNFTIAREVVIGCWWLLWWGEQWKVLFSSGNLCVFYENNLQKGKKPINMRL